jgi:nitrite reductase (NADH) small subunit
MTESSTASQKNKKHSVCKASDLKPGERLLVKISGLPIGVFNVEGAFYALHNRCPHVGGALCEGPLTGTTLPTTEKEYIYAHEGRILRCAWHGWEFEVESGTCLTDSKIKARTYNVSLENGDVIVDLASRRVS